MVLITYINNNIFVTADKLITGDLIVRNFEGKTLLKKQFNETNYISQKMEIIIQKKIKIELITTDEKYTKTINY